MKNDLDSDMLARIRAYNQEQEFMNECNQCKSDRVVAIVMLAVTFLILIGIGACLVTIFSR